MDDSSQSRQGLCEDSCSVEEDHYCLFVSRR